MDKPSRWVEIQFRSGTQTPEVVPFHVKTTSRSGVCCDKSGNCPQGEEKTRLSGKWSWSTTSVIQRLPNKSQPKISTPRAPRKFHNAHSKAPVAEPGMTAI